jgi:hypothetical protein
MEFEVGFIDIGKRTAANLQQIFQSASDTQSKTRQRVSVVERKTNVCARR